MELTIVPTRMRLFSFVGNMKLFFFKISFQKIKKISQNKISKGSLQNVSIQYQKKVKWSR